MRITRWIVSLLVLLGTAADAAAHFVFVVPEAGGATAKVVFSETLKPDADVEIAPIAALKLAARGADGRDAPLKLTPAEHAFVIDLGGGARVVHGAIDYGVMQRGGSEPFLLAYHPKTLVGDPFDPKANAIGEAAPIEIVPVGRPGDVRLKVLVRGKPAEDVELIVLPPNGGKEQEVVTGPDGLTPAFKEEGRYGVWGRYFEDVKGEHGGKPYAQVRRYPTLVFDATPSARADAAATVTRHPLALPQAASSFGAAEAGGYLYVYGGHVVRTHSYSTEAVSGQFHRLKLDGGTTWEQLPAGPALQGMNLVAHGGKIYRAGGMRPVNAPGTRADNYSVADCARFDPATMRWEPIASLPEPRSSHDVVAVGDKLIVVGGWVMEGRARGERWPAAALVLDLAAARPEWKPIRQPFQRRALIAAAHGGKVYALGGFTEHDDPLLRVDVYDPATDTWTAGPDLPGPNRNGFGPAAAAHDGRLYVSLGDGSFHRLDDARGKWEKVATTTPRIVHRLVTHGNQILVLGGAAKGDNFDLIEAVSLTPAAPTATRSAGATE